MLHKFPKRKTCVTYFVFLSRCLQRAYQLVLNNNIVINIKLHLPYFIYIANAKIKKSNNTKSIPSKRKKNAHTGSNKKITAREAIRIIHGYEQISVS